MRLIELKPKPRDGREAFNIIRKKVRKPFVAIYNVGEGHLECAPDAGSPACVERKYGLDSCVLDAIKSRVGSDVHVILAYDFENCEVYIIDAVPELQIASAVLTVLFAEIIGGCGCVREEETFEYEQPDEEWDQPDEEWDDDCPCKCQDDDGSSFDEFFDVTHARNRDKDYLKGLKRLKPTFELTF